MAIVSWHNYKIGRFRWERVCVSGVLKVWCSWISFSYYMRRNDVCTSVSICICIQVSPGMISPNECHWRRASPASLELGCNILSSPISNRAATSELLVALSVSSHGYSVAVLHFSTSPHLHLGFCWSCPETENPFQAQGQVLASQWDLTGSS